MVKNYSKASFHDQMKKGQTKEFWWTEEKVREMNDARISENLSLKTVGQKYGITKQRVQQIFKHFGIDSGKRQLSEQQKVEKFLRQNLISKKVLIDIYVNQNVKIKDVLKTLKTSSKTLYKSLEIHDIPKKGRGTNPPLSALTREVLYKMYIEEEMTARKIAEELGYALVTIQRRLSFLGIKNNKFAKKTES